MQYVRINDVCSEFKEIISKAPQGSIVGSIQLDAFVNDFLNIIKKVFAHNFADDVIILKCSCKDCS